MTRITSPVPRDPNTFTTTLPYDFDTSTMWGSLLKGGMLMTLFLGVILLVGLLMGRFLAILPVAAFIALMMYALRKAAKLEVGSVGTITRDTVQVHHGTLFGRTLPGPSGTYPIAQFTAVRIEKVTASPLQHEARSGPPRLRIYLVGAGATPTIFVADEDNGSELGNELATLLSLPCEQV
jgi:hypothetical protein